MKKRQMRWVVIGRMVEYILAGRSGLAWDLMSRLICCATFVGIAYAAWVVFRDLFRGPGVWWAHVILLIFPGVLFWANLYRLGRCCFIFIKNQRKEASVRYHTLRQELVEELHEPSRVLLRGLKTK